MECNEHNDFVTCPYDSNHHILKTRLTSHLLRCRQNHKHIKMIPCPYNISHMLKEDEFEAHLLLCKSGAKHYINERKDVAPISPAPPRPILEVSEDWDNEPPVPAYNPEIHCRNNLIVRTIRGAQPAVRRRFRESERLRMMELADNEQKKLSKEK